MRHLISGALCAIAGEATAVAAAPAAETFKKSRRFISSHLLVGRFRIWAEKALSARDCTHPPKALAAGHSTDAAQAKRGNGMTALNKSRVSGQAAAITPLS
jgi:hypothetical protein